MPFTLAHDFLARARPMDDGGDSLAALLDERADGRQDGRAVFARSARGAANHPCITTRRWVFSIKGSIKGSESLTHFADMNSDPMRHARSDKESRGQSP